MKLPLSWLTEWLGELPDVERVAERLTMAGHEVDGIETIGAGLEPFQVAQIQRVEPHPNADKLRVCQVSAGGGDSLQIVCGAPNAAQGLKTILAPVGAKMPDGMKIRRSKLRGVESQGMLCSARELGLGDEHDGIIELPASAELGQPIPAALGLPDAVIDLDLTPNRGDCFSVLGIARELAVVFDKPLQAPAMQVPAAESDAEQSVRVSAPAACPRFVSRTVVDIDPGAVTPLWMTERLRRAGLRAISPVVDVTNYVMLELGQPLHAYDLDKISGEIDVRFAEDDESLQLLDEKTLKLNSDVVVIADDSGAIGMAGIMGGLSTAVSDTTTRVLFEGAFWSPAIIRGRARRFGMHTDASLRFERGVDPFGQARAVNRACELMLSIAGGKAGELAEVLNADELPQRHPISLRYQHLQRILGFEVAAADVHQILANLGLEITEKNEEIEVLAPSFRFDLEIAEDLIEEVARIVGYDEIPARTATSELALMSEPEARVEPSWIRSLLVARGFNEVVTYSFVDPGWQNEVCGDSDNLTLANPLSQELSAMRRSLLPGLLKTLGSHRARQASRSRLFEIGNCFVANAQPPEVMRVAGIMWGDRYPEQWAGEGSRADYFDARAIVDVVLGQNGPGLELIKTSAHPGLHPGQSALLKLGGIDVGWLGTIHPKLAQAIDLDSAPVYFELDWAAIETQRLPEFAAISKFPAVRRDIAILVPVETPAGTILAGVKSHCGERLKDVILFDNYQGKGIEAGLKSLALGLILQETSRTLTDEETDSTVRSTAQMLEQKFGATLRDR